MSTSSSSGALKRSITLKQSTIAAYVEGRTQGYRIRLDIIEAQLVAPEIFVYQRIEEPESEVSYRDVFSNVASPADIATYQVGAPATGQQFYRLSYVDLVFRSIDLLQQSLEDLQQDVAELISTLDAMDVLVATCITIDGDYGIETTSITPIQIVVRDRDPGLSDDSTENFGVGSLWLNETSVVWFKLMSNEPDAAIWLQVF